MFYPHFVLKSIWKCALSVVIFMRQGRHGVIGQSNNHATLKIQLRHVQAQSRCDFVTGCLAQFVAALLLCVGGLCNTQSLCNGCLCQSKIFTPRPAWGKALF